MSTRDCPLGLGAPRRYIRPMEILDSHPSDGHDISHDSGDVPGRNEIEDAPGKLRAAVRSGDLETCRALLEADRSLARTTSLRGGSLALEAHERELAEIADLFFDARGDGLDLDVHEAASLGRPNGVRHVLTSDPMAMDEVGPAGFYPLHRAAYRGHVDAALFLLEAGADPRAAAQNASNLTPLHSAVAGMARLGTGPRGLEVVKLLVAAGGDVDATMEGGWSVRDAAARDGLEDAVSLLDTLKSSTTGLDAADGPPA